MYVQDPSALAARHHHALHSELSEAWGELGMLGTNIQPTATTTPQNVQDENVLV